MESSILPVGAAQPAPPPVLHADLRPTADTAALVRDPRPHVPMPMPASIAQKGAVAQAQLSPDTAPVAAVERVLKPYGVVMLPQGPQSTPDQTTQEQPSLADAQGATPDGTRPAAQDPAPERRDAPATDEAAPRDADASGRSDAA